MPYMLHVGFIYGTYIHAYIFKVFCIYVNGYISYMQHIYTTYGKYMTHICIIYMPHMLHVCCIYCTYIHA